MQKNSSTLYIQDPCKYFQIGGPKNFEGKYFGLYFWEVLFWDLNFFDFSPKVGGLLRLYCPLNEEGPVHTILYTGTLGAKRAISFYANNLSR